MFKYIFLDKHDANPVTHLAALEQTHDQLSQHLKHLMDSEYQELISTDV